MPVVFRYLNFLVSMIVFRVVCLCIVKSHFVPDEYWQSLEIAHRTVFGYGYETWEWKKAIRSFFYPFCFSVAYKILEIFRIDNVTYVVLFPRIIQLLLSAVADVYYWLWLEKMISNKSASKKQRLHWTYFMWVMCLMINFCSTRTLTNTAELNFSTIALYYYPWNHKSSEKTCSFLWFIGFACLVRPTAAIQWLPLCLFDVLSSQNSIKYCATVYLKVIFEIVVLSLVIDAIYYKKFVFTFFNFIVYNGQYNIGINYGIHSWFWYITIGIPVVVGPVVVLFYIALFKIGKNIVIHCCKKFIDSDIICKDVFSSSDYLLFASFLWTIFCYSMVPHKEFRFILPLVPIVFYLTGVSYNFNFPKHKLSKNYILVLLVSVSMIIFNVIGIFYLGLWHQVGPLAVISKLSAIAGKNPLQSNFLFLTPCHATPLYSHLHVNITTRFLTCEPNLSNNDFYKDEADIFFDDPQKWLEEKFPKKDLCRIPSHIVLYSNLKPSITTFLNHYNYTQLDVIFNTHFVQGRQSKYFEIFYAEVGEKCFI